VCLFFVCGNLRPTGFQVLTALPHAHKNGISPWPKSLRELRAASAAARRNYIALKNAPELRNSSSRPWRFRRNFFSHTGDARIHRRAPRLPVVLVSAILPLVREL